MWETSNGPRILLPRERALFLHGTLALRDYLPDADEDSDLPEIGISAFDQIPAVDRPHVLLWVAEHVLGDGPAPPPRCWSAGTIAAVFAHLDGRVELEIEDIDLESGIPRTEWRRLIREAWIERCMPDIELQFPNGEGPQQSLDSRDLQEWRFKLEGMTEEILADSDYEVDEILDLSPEKAAAAKEYLGIETDYYTEAPPTFSPEERHRLDTLRKTLVSEADKK